MEKTKLHQTKAHETPETLHKKAIKDFLALRGWYWYANTAGFASKPGIPDMTAIKNGQVVQIEVKSEQGRQSKAQVDFMIDWRRMGGMYVLGGIDEVMAQLANI